MNRASEESVNFWPGLSDMILAAFVIALLLFFGASVVDLLTRGRLALQVKLYEDHSKELERVKERLGDTVSKLERALAKHAELEHSLLSAEEQRRRAEAQLAALRKELEGAKTTEALLDSLQRRAAEVEKLLEALSVQKARLVTDLEAEKKKHDKPPNITLSEAENYTFKSGSAELTIPFQTQLRDTVLPQMMAAFSKYPVEVIEVVGHTDRHVVGARVSNFDTKLVDVLERRAPISVLNFGSNCDLGLMRAIAIREFLQDNIKKIVAGETPQLGMSPEQRTRLAMVQIRPYSAAQAVPAGKIGDEQGDVDRRIEIRFTRLKE